MLCLQPESHVYLELKSNCGNAGRYFVTMTSSNGNIFRVTGHLCEEFTGHRWIPRAKASDAGLRCFLWSAYWLNGWINNREAGDLRRHCAHYDVNVMLSADESACRLIHSSNVWLCGMRHGLPLADVTGCMIGWYQLHWIMGRLQYILGDWSQFLPLSQKSTDSPLAPTCI